MWNMLRGNKGRCMLPEKGYKPLKVSSKIPKSKCIDLVRRYCCSITGRDHTSLFITRWQRILKTRSWQQNVYSQKSQRALLGIVKKGFAIVSVCRLMYDL
jgi:hypothetical protein